MYETILFDLDGTLTDPKIGITKSVQYALDKMGIREDDLDKLEPFIGPPLLWAFKEFYGMNTSEAEQAIAFYRERFSVVGLYENNVYPGIPELLTELQRQGKKLVVATSKPTVFSVKILEHFGLEGYFSLIAGSNLDGTRVEKAEVIEFALKEAGVGNGKGVIMVGDREHDIIGAHKNNLPVVAVSYGYGSTEELANAKPNFIAESVLELEKLLLRK